MSKITLTLLILLCTQAYAQVEGDGGDPNMPMHSGGANVCVSGECRDKPLGYDAFSETKANADAIDKKAKAEALKKAMNQKRYEVQKDDYEPTAQELRAEKMKKLGESIDADSSGKVAEKDNSKFKDPGSIPVGGNTTIRPSRKGIKVKYKQDF